MAAFPRSKKKAITAILNKAKAKGQERKKFRAKLEDPDVTYADLKAIWADLGKQQAGGAQKPPAKRKSSSKKSSSRKRSSRKLPGSLKKRAGQISRAIASGKVAAKQGVTKPSEAKGQTVRDRYNNFLALYKGTRITKRSSGPKVPSIKARLQEVPKTKRQPYYLGRGYHVAAHNVGGGKSGPGIIRAVSGSGAPPFRSLTLAQQQKVIAFLNGPGKQMRSRGARAEVSQQLLKGAANRR